MEPLRLPLESLPLFISVECGDGNDDEETELVDNKSKFDNAADEDPEPPPPPPGEAAAAEPA